MVVFSGFDVTCSALLGLFSASLGMLWVLIPVAGIIWLLVATLAEEKTKREHQEQMHRERMIAIEKGMTEVLEGRLAADLEIQSARNLGHGNPIGLLIGGIVTTGAGLGLTLFLGLATDGSDRNKAMAVGLIPLCVGLSLIAAWIVVRRMGEKR